MDIIFRKSGKEVKAAVKNRCAQLEQRLQRRNQALNDFLKDTPKVRSYLIRSTRPDYSHGRGGYVLCGPADISSEERQEMDQLCDRIFEIEQELHRLALVVAHLDDGAVFDLTLDQLVGYGFDETA